MDKKASSKKVKSFLLSFVTPKKSTVEKAQRRGREFEARIDKVIDLFEAIDQEIINRMQIPLLRVDLAERTALEQLSTCRLSNIKHLSQAESDAIVWTHSYKQLKQQLAQSPAGSFELHPASFLCKAYLEGLALASRISVNLASHLSIKTNLPAVVDKTPPSWHKASVTRVASMRMVYMGFPWITASPGEMKLQTTVSVSHEGKGLNQPYGIEVHPVTHQLFLADSSNHRVLVLSPTDLKVVHSLGKHGKGPGEFQMPTGIAFSLNGDVLVVVDNSNHRVQLFEGFPPYKHTRTLNLELYPNIGLSCAMFAAFDLNDDFYITSWRTRKVEKFNKKGDHLLSLHDQAEKPFPIGEAYGITVNHHNQVLVMSSRTQAVHVFDTSLNHIETVEIDRCDNIVLARGPGDGFIVSDRSGFVRFYARDGTRLGQIPAAVPQGVAYHPHTRQLYVVSNTEGTVSVYGS